MTDLNIKSSTIEKGLELMTKFLSPLVKPTVEELGELLADNVKTWRLKNQVRNIEKVKAIVEKEGITPKAINMKVLFPYIDAIALEDDETLQDMWANLFVNYIDSEKTLTTHVYPDVLRQLSTNEVKTLQYFRNQKMISFDNPDSEFYNNEFDLSKHEVSNLDRLSLIEEHIITEDRKVSRVVASDVFGQEMKPAYIYERTGLYKLTSFGHNFIEACTREPK